jgi:hypothetical protein
MLNPVGLTSQALEKVPRTEYSKMLVLDLVLGALGLSILSNLAR